MSDFDRDALVAAATAEQGNSGNLMFWGAVIALPLIGLAVGAFFMTSSPAQTSPMDIASVEVSEDEALPQQAAAQPVAKVAQAWSADAEMARYNTVRLSMGECGKVMDSEAAFKAQYDFGTRNAERFEKLQAIQSAEWKAGRSDRRKKIQRANNEMVLKAVTGQLQHEVMNDVMEFERQMAMAEASAGQPWVRKTDPAIVAFLGGEPDLAKCSKLQIELQRGEHDIAFAPRG